MINIALYADLTTACQSDQIEDTVNYKTIKQNIVDMVEISSYMLVERLAQHVTDICLKNPRVQRVKVTIDKTRAHLIR